MLRCRGPLAPESTTPASTVDQHRICAGHESLHGTKRTSRDVRSLVAIGRKADMAVASADFRTETLGPSDTPIPDQGRPRTAFRLWPGLHCARSTNECTRQAAGCSGSGPRGSSLLRLARSLSDQLQDFF